MLSPSPIPEMIKHSVTLTIDTPKQAKQKDKRVTSFPRKPQSSTEMYTDRQMDACKNTDCEP